ncbi:MAG: RES domain-containing protein [Leifsonia xyli]|nr:MAG: RES domain-containing protein [Leifsonia xyli]
MASGATVPWTDVPAPPPRLASLVKTMTWPQGQVIHRIHLDSFDANEFNPGLKGNARFSPIRDASGALIPTIYGGETFDCVAMESVFHDVPFAIGLKTFAKSKLAGQIYSTLTPRRDLVLADLSNTALRGLGIRRTELIDTEKDQYPGTRAWAEAIHAACPNVEGLCWVSRQDDRARAAVLFGDRVATSDLGHAPGASAAVLDPPVYGALLALAGQIQVNIVGSL